MRKEVILLAVALVVLTNIVTANTAPMIHDLDSEIIACESSPLSIEFEVAELDGDSLTLGIFPSGPVYIRSIYEEPPITKVELFSDNLTSLFSNKVYEHTVFVSDGEFVDTREIEITILEKNDPPIIEHLGVETININTTDSFEKQVVVTDPESGDILQGDFTFSVTDSLDLLNMEIDSTGLITYTPSESHLGVHEVEVCVTDNGVDLEGKIGICAQEDIRSTTCKRFQLAISEDNSPPTILHFNSTNSSNKIPGTELITFEVYKYDPEGLNPDTYWYVDGKLKQINIGKNADEFTYSFGCEKWGRHRIRAVISDGQYNDSLEWAFDVFSIACLEGTVPREKIGKETCEEKWGCLEWSLCQNALESHQAGTMTVAEYEQMRQRCEARDFNEETCGYQIRNCIDVNDCNTVARKPLELAPCQFTTNPSCSDNIQNCHDGACEFMTDCGGPCDPCPTCSDRILNQGEEEVDCGGPCSKNCVKEEEQTQDDENNLAKASMLLAIIVALTIAVVQIIRIVRSKKIIEEPTDKNLEVRYE